MTRLTFTIDLLPGYPPRAAMREVFAILLEDNALIDVTRVLGQGLPNLSSDGRVEELTDYFYPDHVLAQVAGVPEDPFVSFLFSKSLETRGRIVGQLGEVATNVAIERVLAVTDVVDACMATIEGRPTKGQVARSRERHAMDVAKAELDGRVGHNWRQYLLRGIAYRTILGDDIANLFSEERLAELAPDLGWQEQGRWILAGQSELVALPPDAWGDQEEAVIDALDARDLFFDPGAASPPVRWQSTFRRTTPALFLEHDQLVLRD